MFLLFSLSFFYLCYSQYETQCSNGILTPNQDYCCPTECGTCGGNGCGDRLGGSTNCCTSQFTNLCSSSSPPCIIDKTIVGPDPTCSNGILTSNQDYCCPEECGICGGDGCSNRPGGYLSCCTSDFTKYCSESSAPCIIDGSSPVTLPTNNPTSSPVTLPTNNPTQKPNSNSDPTCDNGILTTNKDYCCPTECGTCGGTGCSTRPGGYLNCCTSDFTKYCSVSTAPCIIDIGQTPSPTLIGSDPTCNNGILTPKNDYCCPEECGTCGGAGCSTRPGGYLNCCTSDFTKFCSDSTAPCIMDGTNPVIVPTNNPTIKPTNNPTIKPVIVPTNNPTIKPVIVPTNNPTIKPVTLPTYPPTNSPTSWPTNSFVTETITNAKLSNNNIDDLIENGYTLIELDEEILSDRTITINADGKSELPTLIKGKITLKGSSKLIIYSDNLIISGFTFYNLEGDKQIIIYGSNNRLTNCVIDGFYNDKTRYINIEGRYNRIDHNIFKNIGTKKGATIVVSRSSGYSWTEDYCLIDSNFFDERINGNENSFEQIRIGNSGTSSGDRSSQTNSKSMVYNNYFSKYRYNKKENEVISVKSGKNIIYKNSLVECQGGIVLRHGKNSYVYYNHFDGKNVINTMGIRVCDSNHIIVNNLIEYVYGNNTLTRAGISITNGNENPDLNEYYRSNNILIKKNIFRNCDNTFILANRISREDLVLTGSGVIEENFISYSNIFNINDTEVSDFTFKNNWIYESTILENRRDGFTESNVDFTINRKLYGSDEYGLTTLNERRNHIYDLQNYYSKLLTYMNN